MKRRLGYGRSHVALRFRGGAVAGPGATALLASAGIDDSGKFGVLARVPGWVQPTSLAWIEILAVGGLIRLLFDGPTPSAVLSLLIAAAWWAWRGVRGTWLGSGELVVVVGADSTHVIDHRGVPIAAFSQRTSLKLAKRERETLRPRYHNVRLVDNERTWCGDISRSARDLLESEWGTRVGSDAILQGGLLQVRTDADLRRRQADLVDENAIVVRFAQQYGPPNWWVWAWMFISIVGVRVAMGHQLMWLVTGPVVVAALVATWWVARSPLFVLVFGVSGTHLIDAFDLVPVRASALLLAEDRLASVHVGRQAWFGRPLGTRRARLRTLWSQRVIESD